MIRRFLGGWLSVFGAALALALTDAAFVLYRYAGEPVAARAMGIGIALWASLMLALPVAALVGALECVRTRDPRIAPWPWRAWRWLAENDRRVHVERVASLTALGILLLVAGNAGVRASFVVVRDVVQDTNAAALVVAIYVALLAVGAAIFPWLRAVLTGVVGWAAEAPFVGPLLHRTWRVVLATTALGGVAVALMARAHWNTLLVYVPWSNVLRLTALVLLVASLSSIGDALARAPRVRSVLAAAPLVLLVALTPLSVGLRPDAWGVKSMVFEGSVGGALARSLLLRVADADHDGALTFLGGGDCAPANRRVHYGATEIPDNGVDEDCDGSDLRGAALAAAGRWDFPVPDAAPTRPDVILITVDALSARRMGVLGYPRKITEHLDDLARRSAFFEAYFTQGPSTRLSFPAMFTGRWDTVIEREPVFRHIPHPIATSERQVQDVFGDAGYDTVAIIPDAYFLPSFWPSLTRGFARVDTSALLRTKEEILRAGGHTADGVTRAALRVLDSKRKKPLFLWAHYYDAHSPYNQPPNAPIFGTTPNDVHDAEVWSVDRAMAPLLERLVDRPNTLLVVTADHATVFHPNPKTRKGHYGYDVYTATLHAPLIVHAPWIRPRRWPKPTSSLDVLPTLANMLRTNPKATLFGTSLVPEIFDASDAHPQYVFSEFFLEERAIRDGKDGLLAVGVRDDRYNLILDRGTGAYELYDWRKDYFETDNLATDPGHRADFDRLKALVGAFVFEMSEKPRQRRAEAARSAPMPTPVPGVLPPSDPR